MSRNAPFLDFPSSGWKRDLPCPDDKPEPIHGLIRRENTPNSIDDIYMELSTKTLALRGVVGWLGILLISTGIYGLLFFTASYFHWGASPRFWMFILEIAIIIGSFWSGLCMLRTELHMPRDEPIRFNRLRRKVYAYRYMRDWRRPFNRSAWEVKIATYDWEHLHAEACEAYGAMGTGGNIQTVNLSIVTPGTREYTDRFIFKHNIYDGEEAWSMTQLFMQQGPEALPKFLSLPRDRNSEKSLFNVFWRFAPLTQWPSDIDIESRTAPPAGEVQTTPCEAQ